MATNQQITPNQVSAYAFIMCIVAALLLGAYACQDDSLMPPVHDSDIIGSGDAALIEDMDTPADTAWITAREFEFPIVKEIGDGVTFFHQVNMNFLCGNAYTYSTINSYGIDIYDYQEDHIKFVINDNAWFYQYQVCCPNDPTVCDSGFLIGTAN